MMDGGIAVKTLQSNLHYECETKLYGIKIPLSENVMEGVNEQKDQRIAETRKQG